MKKTDRGHLTRYESTDVAAKLRTIHGQRFVDYRNKWERTCKCGDESEYPLFIEIGVNSDCNLRCKMCARNFDTSMNNRHINMPLELVDKIVEQCKTIQLPAVLIGQDSECLLHPQIKEIVRKIKTI